MRHSEIVSLLHDVETLFRGDDWRNVSPHAVAEIAAMARHALELQPGSQARASDPSTSRKAAQNATVRAGSQRHTLLQQYAHSEGLTDEQAGRMAGLLRPGVCYWKRCSELRQAGYIKPTGETRVSLAGVVQQVCAITEAGLDALANAR